MADSNKNPKQTPAEKAVEHYFRVLEEVQVKPAQKNDSLRKIDINEEIAREQKIKNDDAEQDIKLKRMTLLGLFIFLGIETTLIFLFSLFQAIHAPHSFQLEEWSFKLVVTATLAQITGMLFVAVRYLFPKK